MGRPGRRELIAGCGRAAEGPATCARTRMTACRKRCPDRGLRLRISRRDVAGLVRVGANTHTRCRRIVPHRSGRPSPWRVVASRTRRGLRRADPRPSPGLERALRGTPGPLHRVRPWSDTGRLLHGEFAGSQVVARSTSARGSDPAPCPSGRCLPPDRARPPFEEWRPVTAKIDWPHRGHGGLPYLTSSASAAPGLPTALS